MSAEWPAAAAAKALSIADLTKSVSAMGRSVYGAKGKRPRIGLTTATGVNLVAGAGNGQGCQHKQPFEALARRCKRVRKYD